MTDSQTNGTTPLDNEQMHSSEDHTTTPKRSISGSFLNPRSCTTCRRRKVRCNKENPCSNCLRAGIECIFPGPGRAPRKSRKAPDSELMVRLRRLEGVVHSLGAQVDENGGITRTQPLSPESRTKDNQEGTDDGTGNDDQGNRRTSIEKHLGRLVINEDRSRYVSNSFWASMGDEIAEMRDLLDEPSSEEEDEYDSPQHEKLTSHQGFIFGYSSLMVDLRELHPTPSQTFILWEVFKENIDPVIRILHKPTARNILLNAASNIDGVSRAAEALLFSIYFGAVVSLSEQQCEQLLGQSKETLTKKYRFATEQALARADFLNSSSLICLQAFVFFLVFLRTFDDSRLVWAFGGLAIHLAQALGIHRDGSNFNLSAFDTEMRRRLWWHISILDSRSAEDHGTDPTFTQQYFDTKLPMNINDEDIHQEMKDFPPERTGATEMTFCLIRFELVIFSRKFNITGSGRDTDQLRDQPLQEKERLIDHCHRQIEEKYLRHCDMNQSIYWVSATVARLILAKMWLMVHHPRSFIADQEGSPLPSATKDRLFITSVEVIEFSHLLEENENTSKWGWLFRSYTQWQSVAFVLSELCNRPSGPDVDRAWRAIEPLYDSRAINKDRHQRGMLWKPMRHLMAKARLHRAAQTQDVDKDQLPTEMDFQSTTTTSSASDPWNQVYSAPTFLSNTAEALGLDLSPTFPMAGSKQQVLGISTKIPAQKSQGGARITPKETPISPTQPDFLNWQGWNPGVGDFNVAPEPFSQYFANVQQEWF